MLFRLVVALTWFFGASAGTLHEVLAEKAQQYGNVQGLKTELRKILDDSRALLETRTSVQGLTPVTKRPSRQLHAEGAKASFEDLVQKTSKSLGDLERVADSHPILAILSRRTFLAGVVLQWLLLGQKPIGADVERKLSGLTSKFYHIHVTSVVRRGLLEYLHISKSGGTSFSAAAKHSGCLMAPGIGQLEALGDLPRWINGTAFEELTGGTSIMWSYYGSKGRPAQGQSCTGRLAHLKELGYNYVSNEFTLHGGGGSGGGGGGSRGAEGLHATHVCPGSVNVVTLRQPDGRLASHLHYMLARVKKRLLGKTDFDTSDFFDTFCTGDVAMWQRVAPPVVDNYALRSFIGERAFHSPVGGIGSEHVKVARRLLLQFDLVMDLDAGEEAADLAMRQGLGWNVSLSELHVRTSSQTFAKLHYSKEDCPNEELLRLLLPRQEPDRQLYSTGRTLAFLDGVFLDVAQALGLRPNSLAAGTVPPPARGTGTVKGSPACGLLNAGATGRRKTAGRKARLMVR